MHQTSVSASALTSATHVGLGPPSRLILCMRKSGPREVAGPCWGEQVKSQCRNPGTCVPKAQSSSVGQGVGSPTCPCSCVPCPPQPPPGQPPRKENLKEQCLHQRTRDQFANASQTPRPASRRLVMGILEKSAVWNRNRKERAVGEVGCRRLSPAQGGDPRRRGDSASACALSSKGCVRHRDRDTGVPPPVPSCHP